MAKALLDYREGPSALWRLNMPSLAWGGALFNIETEHKETLPEVDPSHRRAVILFSVGSLPPVLSLTALNPPVPCCCVSMGHNWGYVEMHSFDRECGKREERFPSIPFWVSRTDVQGESNSCSLFLGAQLPREADFSRAVLGSTFI